MPTDWRDELKRQLPLLGHRNWLCIVDAAFPWSIAPGIEMLESREEIGEVLAFGLQAVGDAPHLRPITHLARELDFVPHARSLRQELLNAIEGLETRRTLHSDILATLDRVGREYRILMLKTTCVIPYTSVFFELECGYWPAEAEAEMREAMV